MTSHQQQHLYIWGNTDWSNDSDSYPSHPTQQIDFPFRIPDAPMYQQQQTATTAATQQSAKSQQTQTVPLVISFSVGTKHAVVILSNREVWGLGSNKSGQLGGATGFSESSDSFKRILNFPQTETAPMEVTCGHRFTIVRCADGTLYSTGDNSLGQLGRKTGSSKSASGGWGKIAFPPGAGPIETVAIGFETCFALSSGQVYSWGSQCAGSLGHGTTGMDDETFKFKDVTSPKRIEFFANHCLYVLQIAAGFQHFVARTQDDVYCCGEGFYGKLGQGDLEQCLRPSRVTFPSLQQGGGKAEKLIDIAAGEDHTLVLRERKDGSKILYHWGRKVGNNDEGSLSPTPVLIAPALQPVRISASKQYSMAVTDVGEALIWGKFQRASTLGHLATVDKRNPEPMELLEELQVKAIRGSRSFIMALAEVPDAPATTDPSAIDPRAHVVVPFKNRYKLIGVSKLKLLTFFEDAARAYCRRCLGEERGDAYFQALPQPDPLVEKVSSITRRGAHSLHAGSKVRVWMGDVYALGTVVASASDLQKEASSSQLLARAGSTSSAIGGATPTPKKKRRKTEAGKAMNDNNDNEDHDDDITGVLKLTANQFEVDWLREDWDAEIVELHSDDETLDDENENRWQHLWFLDSEK